MRVLFWDSCCPKPYSYTTLMTEPLGGTEATVVRVSEALAQLGVEVDVWQHNRISTISSGSIRYVGPVAPLAEKYSHIVVLRDPAALKIVKSRWVGAKAYLWLHDLPTAHLARFHSGYVAEKVSLVCVSDWHQHQVVQMLKASGYNGEYRVNYIYNPIDENLLPDNTPIDKNKLVFFSSPHKGLDYALFSFGRLREFLPHLKMYVSNPGYLPSRETTDPAVVNLGSLPHHEAIKHVRDAFCVFYPNTVFPETFGLVYAEANAVGTPVFAQRIGAAREVLGDEVQAYDVRDPKKLIDRFLMWYQGTRPVVSANPKFRISEVVKQWKTLLK